MLQCIVFLKTLKIKIIMGFVVKQFFFRKKKKRSDVKFNKKVASSKQFWISRFQIVIKLISEPQ